jgi:hypothetical protein
MAEILSLTALDPSQGILISTLGLQEAQDSSAIENIVMAARSIAPEHLLSALP